MAITTITIATNIAATVTTNSSIATAAATSARKEKITMYTQCALYSPDRR